MIEEFKKFKSWFEGSRLCNVDESQYRSRGLTRILTNPALQTSLVLDAVASLAETAGSPHAEHAANFFFAFVVNGYMIPMMHGARAMSFNEVPQSKKWGIDKEGRFAGDPEATLETKDIHTRLSQFSLAMIPAMPAFLSLPFVVAAIINPMDKWSIEGVAGFSGFFVAIPTTIASLPFALRSMRVVQKITDKKWTVCANLPEKKKSPVVQTSFLKPIKATIPDGRLNTLQP